MSLTGKSTLSLRKKDVLEQKQAGSAYKRLVFAHKATAAGQTGINITSLTQPSEMASLGFTNPSTPELQAAKLLFFKKNLTVISSSKGVLMQDLSYTVPTNERIAFQGFTSDEGEIFTCILETAVRDGLLVADASRIMSSGTLSAGSTQYNVGTPFAVGKYITQQAGSVLVFLDGVQQFRNSSNSNSNLDANYYEVDAGGGLGSIITFNTPDVVNARSVLVVGELTAERPAGSTMAVVESLAGQVDLLIPTVAALAGQPGSNFQGAPNNVDLKNFGDRVLTAETNIALDIANLVAITGQTVSGSSGFFDIGNLRIQWGNFAQVSAGASVVNLAQSYGVANFRVFLQSTNQTGWTAQAAPTSTTTFTSTTGVVGTPNVSYLTLGQKV